MRNVETKSDVQVLAPAAVVFDGLRFSPDGNYIYFGRTNTMADAGDLYVLPVLGGEPRRIFEGVLRAISFSPDGKAMALLHPDFSAGKMEIRIVNADGSSSRALTSLPFAPFMYGTSWSPDGKSLGGVQRAGERELGCEVGSGCYTDGRRKGERAVREPGRDWQGRMDRGRRRVAGSDRKPGGTAASTVEHFVPEWRGAEIHERSFQLRPVSGCDRATARRWQRSRRGRYHTCGLLPTGKR